MTTVLKDAGLKMARCSACDHDLAVPTQAAQRGSRNGSANGSVYCTNSACKFSRQPHPTGKSENAGKRAIS